MELSSCSCSAAASRISSQLCVTSLRSFEQLVVNLVIARNPGFRCDSRRKSAECGRGEVRCRTWIVAYSRDSRRECEGVLWRNDRPGFIGYHVRNPTYVGGYHGNSRRYCFEQHHWSSFRSRTQRHDVERTHKLGGVI